MYNISLPPIHNGTLRQALRAPSLSILKLISTQFPACMLSANAARSDNNCRSGGQKPRKIAHFQVINNKAGGLNRRLLAPKVLLDYLHPMITIQSHPTHPQSLFNYLNRPLIDLSQPPMTTNDYQ